jgi:tRNA dimethylallyltransferase
MRATKRSRLLFLFGPTGVGKTDMLRRCFASGYEIISADSMQVYRHMDIGTAKPSPQMLESIPHHLIDTHHPSQQFSVGDFVSLAHQKIHEIEKRGHLPIVSGGTAFYFKHLLLGLPEAPPSSVLLRKELEKRAQREGLGQLYAELCEADPVSSARIHPSDAYRIIRALEVFHTAGRPLCSYRAVSSSALEDTEVCVIGLWRERQELKNRIRQRVNLMYDQGLIGEVRHLMENGAEPEWPGMRGIGYREFFIAAQGGELSLRGVRDLIAFNSIRYAKRQMTFFRSLPDVQWIHADDVQQLLSACDTFYGGSHQ